MTWWSWNVTTKFSQPAIQLDRLLAIQSSRTTFLTAWEGAGGDSRLAPCHGASSPEVFHALHMPQEFYHVLSTWTWIFTEWNCIGCEKHIQTIVWSPGYSSISPLLMQSHRVPFKMEKDVEAATTFAVCERWNGTSVVIQVILETGMEPPKASTSGHNCRNRPSLFQTPITFTPPRHIRRPISRRLQWKGRWKSRFGKNGGAQPVNYTTLNSEPCVFDDPFVSHRLQRYSIYPYIVKLSFRIESWTVNSMQAFQMKPWTTSKRPSPFLQATLLDYCHCIAVFWMTGMFIIW